MFFKRNIKSSFFAIALFFAFSYLHCQDALSLFNKGKSFQNDDDYFSAIENYREAVSKNPQYGEAWYNLALCTYYLGEYDLALEYINEALKYAKNYSQMQNLKGQIYVSLGNIEKARKIFSDILKEYPNSVDARFGLAELDLFDGNFITAEKRYLDALKRDATNRKTLLSLALVSAEMQKDDLAERYINLALEHHSGEKGVHYLASYLACKRGDFEEAEKRARSAVQIDRNFDKAYELLSGILYTQGRYKEVVDLCDYRISRKRDLSAAWYLKAKSLSKLNRIDEAITSYNTGLSINPQDEIMRFALENLVAGELDLEDERRIQWEKYHLDKALEYSRNYDGVSERYEYQRALSINPLDQNARQKFADMLEKEGLYELYLHQLKFIKENFYEKTPAEVQKQYTENSPLRKKSLQEQRNDDVIASLENLMEDNLSAKWNVDPFYFDKTRWNIGVYYMQTQVQLLHPDSSEILALSVKNIFSGVASTSVEVKTDPVSGYGQAYRLARNSGLDYFLILNTDETERAFSISAELYSARTGTKTCDFHIYRTGNDRVSKALRRLRSAVLDVLPVRGKVLQIANGSVLVDLGKSDGIVKGAVFDIVKKGSIITKDAGPGLSYNESNVVGTFVAERVDEEICEGKYTKKGFYDTLNQEDEVILIKLPEEDTSKKTDAANETRPGADREGRPATNQAKTIERESLKESLKTPVRETTLLNMIEQVY